MVWNSDGCGGAIDQRMLGILRYAFLLDAGRGGAPEEIVLADRPLQVIGVLWLAAVICGVYLA